MKALPRAIMLYFFIAIHGCSAGASDDCSLSYFQGCRSCTDLARITAESEPDYGDYYRGAQWNGLYAAYVHNCLDVAKDLLKRGANPNWGGSQGSMALSISDKWPHHDKKVNRIWADLLLSYGANARKKVPDQDGTPEQTANQDGFKPDYPDIFRMFLRR